jgi:uncharacterized membrane protein (UPF0127 family)
MRSGKEIAQRIDIARTFFKRLMGWMGRTTLMEGQGLYIPGCRSIHTFGMNVAIDVLFLDKQFNITKMVSCLNPNRVMFAPFATRHTLELACGVLKQHDLEVGDQMALINKNEGCNDAVEHIQH